MLLNFYGHVYMFFAVFKFPFENPSLKLEQKTSSFPFSEPTFFGV